MTIKAAGRDSGAISLPARMLILASFLMDACMAMISLAIQNFGIYVLHAPNIVLGLFPTFGSAGYTSGCLVSGRVADRWGRKRSAVAAAVAVALIWMLLPAARSSLAVLCMVPFSGLAMAFFWPSLQAWLGETCRSEASVLGRVLGLFNVMWCTGLMVGPVAAGYLWEAGYRWAFMIPAVLVLGLALLILRIPAGGAEHRSEKDAPATGCVDPRTHFFLVLARIGNFVAFLSCGVILALFPKLGAVLGYSPVLVGWILAAYRLGQTAVFAYTWLDHRWQYRLWPLVVSEVVGAAALVLASTASRPAAFATVFAVAGMCGGVTYVSSLFYSLHNRTGRRGRAAGIHEAILGAGILTGPLLGGVLAEWLSLRSSFAAAGAVLALAATVQIVMTMRRTEYQT